MTFPNRNPGGYLGNNATYIPNVIKTDRAPTANDSRNVKVMDEWYDTSTGKWYKLLSLSAGVADWELQISSGIGIDSVAVQTGTSPVTADGTGLITINGALVAAGTNPIRTDGTGANTLAVEVQTAQAIAATNASNVGLAAFNNSHFSVDANGFVSLTGGGTAIDSFTVPGGTSPVVPDGAGNIDLPAGNGFAFTGGTNAMTGNMVSPFTGTFGFTDVVSGSTQVVFVENTSNTADSHAVFSAISGGTASGDPYAHFVIPATRFYAFGIDNSDSDTFKFNTDVSPVSPSSGTNIFNITSGGVTTFALNDVAVSRSASGAPVNLTVVNSSNTASSTAQVGINVAGTTALQAITSYSVTGGSQYTSGIFASDGSYRIAPTTGIGSGDTFKITQGGAVTMPLQPSFIATHSVGQPNVTGAGAVVTVNFTSVIANRGSAYDGTNTFTAPVTGLYRFSANVYIDNLAAAMTSGLIQFMTTARVYQNYYNPGASMTNGASLSLSLTTLADMTAGDTCIVQIQASNGAGNTAGAPAQPTISFFSGELVV